MVELQLETETESLLAHFAAQAGKSKAELARQAVLSFLEDREDYEAGVQALKESEGQPRHSLAEVVESLGLEGEFSHQSTEASGEPGSNRAKADSQLPLRQTARVA
jgi:predicted DNA-binding protein